jgi:hypothetical protein
MGRRYLSRDKETANTGSTIAWHDFIWVWLGEADSTESFGVCVWGEAGSATHCTLTPILLEKFAKRLLL